MGFWGSSLYSNDCTCDVRDYYLDLLKSDPEEKDLSERVIEHFREYLGTDEEPLFWYALADSQWQKGRLDPDVREKALQWLQKNGGLEFWEDSKTKGTGWIKTMEKLRERLHTPQPKKTRINRAQVLTNPWDIGDVYAYCFHLEQSKDIGLYQKYILMQKIGDSKHMGVVYSHIRVFDRIFDEIPTVEALSNVRILPLDSAVRFMPSGRVQLFPKLLLSAAMLLRSNREYPRKHLTYVGKYITPENVPSYAGWRDIYAWGCMERDWAALYNTWKDYDYELFENESVVTKRTSTK